MKRFLLCLLFAMACLQPKAIAGTTKYEYAELIVDEKGLTVFQDIVTIIYGKEQGQILGGGKDLSEALDKVYKKLGGTEKVSGEFELMVAILNKLGDDGWDLATITQDGSYKKYIFKRAKQD